MTLLNRLGKSSLLAAFRNIVLGAAEAPPQLAPFKQHTNPAGNERRHVKKMIGARQYRKQRKALARAAREMR